MECFVSVSMRSTRWCESRAAASDFDPEFVDEDFAAMAPSGLAAAAARTAA